LLVKLNNTTVNPQLSLIAQNVAAATGGSQIPILQALQQMVLQTASSGGGTIQVQKFVTNIKNSVNRDPKGSGQAIKAHWDAVTKPPTVNGPGTPTITGSPQKAGNPSTAVTKPPTVNGPGTPTITGSPGSTNNPALTGTSPNSDVGGGTNNPALTGTSPNSDVGGSSKDGGTVGGFSAQRSASSDIGTSSDNNLFSGAIFPSSRFVINSVCAFISILGIIK